MGLKKKVDLTPIWDKPPLKRTNGVRNLYIKESKEIKLFVLYKRVVWKLTELEAHKVIDVYKRSFRNYDIDHKISIHYGFMNNILPWCIADVSNLRILDNKSNFLKNKSIFVDNTNLWIIIE